MPVSGRGRGDGPDVAHGRLAIECKHRASLPGWLLDAMRQARVASTDHKAPVVILHGHGSRHDDNLCVLRVSDLAAILDELGNPNNPNT